MNTPRVSVVMPTYNRADTVRRAIHSVQAQSDGDWELVVVDDGSVDDTPAVVGALAQADPRIRYVRQQNQGIAGARNTALTHCQGPYIAFLDSDDEWLPHHLLLARRFFDAFPDQQVLTSEIWEDFGGGRIVKHYRVECEQWYPRIARLIGSQGFALPPGETDDMLRVFQTRQPIGAWAHPVLAATPYRDVVHYRGNIFPAWRWGWMMTVQPVVVTRAALDVAAPFDTTYAGATDYAFLARLCRRFPVNYLSLPACTKHELAQGQSALKQEHVAKGKHANVMAKELLSLLNIFYGGPEYGGGYGGQYGDHQGPYPDLPGLRGFRQLYIAQTALENGRRDEALHYLTQAIANCPRLWPARALMLLVRAVPDPDRLQKIYQLWERALYAARQLARGELTVWAFTRSAVRRARALTSALTA